MSTYTPISHPDLLRNLKGLETFIRAFLFNIRKYPNDLQFDVSPLVLINMIIQIDKRIAHYEFFHGMKINEAKKIGIFMYWIIKFKPIRITDTRFRNRLDTLSLNELFAFHLLRSVLKTLNRDISIRQGNSALWDELLYSLRYRTFTVGSMMVLADSFY